jgi:hypothetical protein
MTQDGWIKSDKIKRGTTYTVARIMEESSGSVLRVEPEHGARGLYWIRMDSFVPAPVEKPVEAPKPAPKVPLDLPKPITHNEMCLSTFKAGDKVRFLASKTPTSFYNEADYYTKQAGLKPTGVYTVKEVGVTNSMDAEFGKAYITLEDREFCHPYDCFELVKEEPKPVETKKPRLMLCVNMSDSSADYTVGKVYKLTNEDDDYYYFKRNDQGVGGGGMFKHRFIEIKDGVENSVKVLCINNKGGYEDQLTVGKIYEAQPSTDGPAYWKIPVSDKGTSTAGLKSRFTVLTDETTKREWKVGDTITSKFLNDSEIEKEFHGYDAGWNIYAHRSFMRDRTVEVIQEREGKRAARISGTMDIWITLESLELHP